MTQADIIRDNYLIPMVRDFQQLGVNDEKGVYFQDGKIRFTYPNWNTTRSEQIRKNGSLLAIDTDYTVDYMNGWLTPITTVLSTDDLVGRYFFQYFSLADLDSFLEKSVAVMNAKNPGSSFTVDTIDMNRQLAVVVTGAYIECLKRLILDNMIWKNALIWANPQGALGLLQSLLSSSMAEYTDMKTDLTRRQLIQPKTMKTGRYGQDYTVTGNNFWRFTVLGN